MGSYYKVARPVAQGNWAGDAWRATKDFVVGAPQTPAQKAKAAAKKQSSQLTKAAELHAQNVAVAQQFAAVAKQKQMIIIAGGVTFGVVMLALLLKKKVA